MVFLLIRFLPYVIFPAYFILARLIFAFTDFWFWPLALVFVMLGFYFFLLKIKSPAKNMLFLFLFAAVFSFAGLAYSFILENDWIINIFLAVWSIVLWLYLESVFHDFYDTKRKHIVNLENITLYGNILVIFFLSSALLSWQIFLNFSYPLIFAFLASVYFCLLYLACSRQGFTARQSTVKSAVLALILSEILLGFKFLPVSFYVSSACLAVVYYWLFNLIVLDYKGQLSSKNSIKYAIFALGLIVLILLTAVWL